MAAPAVEIEGVGKRYRLGRGYGEGSDLSQRIDAAMRSPLRLFADEGPGAAAGEGRGVLGPPRRLARGRARRGRRVHRRQRRRQEHAAEAALADHAADRGADHAPRARSASLLEVGTGFHPELTGRENVFLNGAILGMRKREIEARFDEIVEFSGIEQFIDTPVKRYSSGMYVRLAFAVAAHLEPEILLVDEVLSVGDAEFQR